MSRNEFVYWIATTNGCVEEILREHARDGETCRGCGHLWPCNMRQRAVEAQALRTELMTSPRHDEPGPPEPLTVPLRQDVESGGRPVIEPDDPAPITAVSFCPGPDAPAGLRAQWVHRRAAVLASNPTGRELIARLHEVGHGGRCRHCPGEYWPCPFVVAALLAPLRTPTGGVGITWFKETVSGMDTYHMETDDEVFQAAQAFSTALDRHRDTHRYGGGYWVEGTVEAITAALLLDGWKPPAPPPGTGAARPLDDGS